jgi:hypothetical protein
MKKLEKRERRLSVLVLFLVFLGSCESISYDCPVPVFYTNEFQEEVADALERANEPSLYELSIDYHNLRKELKQ